MLREALFYEPQEGGRVLCSLCALDCKIAPGHRGACGVRVNVDDTLYTLVYGKLVARYTDPIEKKPLFHFQPGSRSYSIATAGCNFRCLHCQNYELSQQPKQKTPPIHANGNGNLEGRAISLRTAEMMIPGEELTPARVVGAALRGGCRSIAYTYTEPTIFFEFAYDTARLAAAEGLSNVFVTNGCIGEEPLATLAPYLDAANIDLKSFNDRAHKRLTGAPLQPVLDGIRAYRNLGIWVEVTTLVIPGFNDSDRELEAIAGFLSGLDAGIPWHVTQFHPAYRLRDWVTTSPATLRRARRIGERMGLRYVYEGNVPDEGGEDTSCHVCHATLIERYGYRVLSNRIRNGHCPACNTQIPGCWVS